MRRMAALLLVGVILLLAISAAKAETAEDLLEKGVYQEETVGDLDGAMKIYRQVVEDGKANRPFVAEAQYRLGVCLLKQGKKAEAKQTFKDLVRRFPDQKKLVAKAKKHIETALKLLPAPWADDEVFQITLKTGGGTKLGNYIFHAKKAKFKGKRVWRLQYWQRLGGNTFTGTSCVQADLESLRPVHSLVDNTVFGRFDANYRPNEVIIRSVIRGKKSERKLPVNGVVYDNEEGYWVFRCLPLAVGYETNLPIFVTFGTGQIGLAFQTPAKEKVKVAAGKFECYRMELQIGQTFWVSADKNHYLVKFEAAGLVGELTAVNPKNFNRFSDKKWGCSIEAPKGWFMAKSVDCTSDKFLVDIIDPESPAVTILAFEKLKKEKSDKPITIRQRVEKNLPELSGRFKDFKVQPKSWTERTISGRPGISFVADIRVAKEKKVAYVTSVQGESTCGTVVVQIAPEALKDYRKKIDSVIDTIKAK